MPRPFRSEESMVTELSHESERPATGVSPVRLEGDGSSRPIGPSPGVAAAAIPGSGVELPAQEVCLFWATSPSPLQ